MIRNHHVEEITPCQPRGEFGQFISRKCPDPNCSGKLVYSEPFVSYGYRYGGFWYCDGLTYDTETGPLRACRYTHRDGEPGT